MPFKFKFPVLWIVISASDFIVSAPVLFISVLPVTLKLWFPFMVSVLFFETSSFLAPVISMVISPLLRVISIFPSLSVIFSFPFVMFRILSPFFIVRVSFTAPLLALSSSVLLPFVIVRE